MSHCYGYRTDQWSYEIYSPNQKQREPKHLFIYVNLLQHSMKTHKNTYVRKLLRPLRMQDIRPRALDECRFCVREQVDCRFCVGEQVNCRFCVGEQVKCRFCVKGRGELQCLGQAVDFLRFQVQVHVIEARPDNRQRIVVTSDFDKIT
jgi:hypothetical protein